MVMLHIAFTLGLIALVAGVSLYLWSVRAEPGHGVGFAKVIGIIVIVLSILSLLCNVYSAFRFRDYMHNKAFMMDGSRPMMQNNAPMSSPGAPGTPVNSPT